MVESLEYEDLEKKARGFLAADETYCDWAASALPLPRNPPAFVPPHHASSAILDKGRAAVRQFLNDDVGNYHIIFTSGTTASFQLLAYRIPWSKNDTFLCHRHVHNAVLGIRNVAVHSSAEFVSLSTSEVSSEVSGQSNGTRNEGFLVFAFPAECNVTGALYPMTWCKMAKSNQMLGYPGEKVIIIVDTTKFLASRRFSVDDHPNVDALVFSLCKLSSTYTGLGVLLIRKKTYLEQLLQSSGTVAYFGGQSSEAITPFSTTLHLPSPSLERTLSSGTPNLDAIRALPELLGSVVPCLLDGTSAESIGKEFRTLLRAAFPQVSIHCDELTERSYATTSFTLFRAGMPVGHHEIATVLSLNGVHVRAGTMCNIGATATMLGLTDKDLVDFHKRGHRCGDGVDLVDSRATGLVRVSFGWGSKLEDAKRVVSVLSEFIGTGMRRQLSEDGRRVTRRLFTYPVRGCKGVEVESLSCTVAGLQGNRTFGVIDPQTGIVLDAKKCPALARIQALYASSISQLTLSDADSTLSLKVNEMTDSGIRELYDGKGSCGVGMDDITVINHEGAESWLCKTLGQAAGLALLHGYKRDVLVVTEQEIAEVGRGCGMGFEEVITAIRPNVVLSGGGVSADFVTLSGSVTLKRIRRCTRCTTVNTISGLVGEPLRSIARLARRHGGGLALGCIMRSDEGILRSGETLTLEG